jgi:hypothetical protein
MHPKMSLILSDVPSKCKLLSIQSQNWLIVHPSATSEPKGPVYLWARREVLEKEIDESLFNTRTSLFRWPSIEPGALSPSGGLP